MKVGDAVICQCEVDMWYKGVPGIIVETGLWRTLVLIKGEIIDIAPSSLELI